MLVFLFLTLGTSILSNNVSAQEEILMCKVVTQIQILPNYIENKVSKSINISDLPQTSLNLPKTEKKPVTILPDATVKKPAVVTTPSDIDPLFEKYAAEYGISSTTLKIIAKCESGFNPGAQSKNGLYGGLFQFSASTWKSTRKAMGLDENPDLRFNAEEAIKTTSFKIANGGIGAWPHCGQIATK